MNIPPSVSEAILNLFKETARELGEKLRALDEVYAPREEASNSYNIVRQVNNDEQLVKAQSEYLQRNEEREEELQVIQGELVELQENVQLVKAQSEYLQRNEEREEELQVIQGELVELQENIGGLETLITDIRREQEAYFYQLTEYELAFKLESLELQKAQLKQESKIAAAQAEREERALKLWERQLQLMKEELADRRQLSALQRDLMRELQANEIEQSWKQLEKVLEANWDDKYWPSKLSRQETEKILHNTKSFLVLIAPPQISPDCPQSFSNNLQIEIRNEVKSFLENKRFPESKLEQKVFDKNVSNGNNLWSVEFYGDYFKNPITKSDVVKISHILASIPTVVIYSEITDHKVYFNGSLWGLGSKLIEFTIGEWNWESAKVQLDNVQNDIEHSNEGSLRIIRKIIVIIHKLLVSFFTDVYYTFIDQNYEPWLLKSEGSYFLKDRPDFRDKLDLYLIDEWFDKQWITPYTEILKNYQYQSRSNFWYTQGRQFHEKDNYQKAANYFAKAAEFLKPDYEHYYDTYYYQGIAYYNLRNWDKAVNSFDRAIDSKRESHEAWNYRGLALNKLGRSEDALNSFEQALRIQPNASDILLKKGMALADLDRHEEALISYQQAQEFNSDIEYNWEWWYNLGISQAALGAYEEAIVSYDKALELEPDELQFPLYKGITLAQLGRYQEAINSFEEARESNPYIDEYNWEWWYNLGLAQAGLGKYQDAYTSYSNAYEFNPKLSEAWEWWNNRGVALADIGDYQAALTSYIKAHELNPNLSQTWEWWYRLGITQAKLCRHEEALNSYQEALKIKANNYDILLEISKVLANLHRYKEAFKIYKEILEFKPKDSDALRHLSNLLSRWFIYKSEATMKWIVQKLTAHKSR
jgi:tetratricopeptide (TPR) repeat protein